MKNLLELVQNYQSGGYVNPFNLSGQPTQEGVMGQYDIKLTDDKYAPFIPTYDQTGENFLRTNYIQDRQGLYGGARNTLGQLSQKSRETSAQQGFAGAGKSLLDTNRGDIVDQFGMDAQRMYTGLQQDIYGRRRDYDEDVLSAIADLPDDAYTMGEGDRGGGGKPEPPDSLGFNPDGSVPGGNNTDPSAPWNTYNYDPANFGEGSSYMDTNGYIYLFNPANGSWLWDGISGG